MNMSLSGLVWPVVAVTAMRIVPWAIVVLLSLRGCSRLRRPSCCTPGLNFSGRFTDGEFAGRRPFARLLWPIQIRP